MLTHARTALTLLATVGVVTAGSGCTDTGPASEPTTTAAGPTATVGQVTTVGFDDNTVHHYGCAFLNPDGRMENFLQRLVFQLELAHRG